MKSKKRRAGLTILIVVSALALVAAAAFFIVRTVRQNALWLQQAETSLRARIGMDFNGTPVLPQSGLFEVEAPGGRSREIDFEGSETSMLIQSSALDCKMTFSLAPAEIEVMVRSGETLVFAGSLDAFAEFVPPANGEYNFKVTARYEEAEFSGSCVYAFVVDYQVQPVFALSAASVPQGGVLLLTGSNLRSQQLEIAVPYSFQPQVVFSGTSCVGILPFNFVRQPGDYSLTVTYEGAVFELPYTVTASEFDIQHLTISQETVSSTVGNSAALQEYNDTVYSNLGTFDPNIYWSGTFIQPAEGWISTEYGSQRITNGVPGNAHDGIDIAADVGTPVVATNGAKVLYSGYLTVSGYTIILDHGMGLQTLHLHMSGVEVETGDIVQKGEVIGYVGSEGYATGPHLHFSMYVGGHAINPWMAFDGTAEFYQLEDWVQ